MYKAFTTKKINNKETITDPVSMFMPDEKTRDVTSMVLKDFLFSWNNYNRTRREFNDRSVQQEVDVNQQAFNSYVPPKSEDPDESWRAQTVRPVTRNKLIAIAAHVTTTILYPSVFAQNDSDEEDKDAAEVMRDLIEWNISHSNYVQNFLTAVISALVDPAVLVKAEFAEVYRTIKEIKENGTWSPKEVLDETLSGFQINVVPIKELLISNIYEPNIQKQRFIIHNRYVDYEESKLKWGTHKNFQYVKPGVRAVFDPLTRGFYDIVDEELKMYLVNEVTYYNRYLDLEITFINGILVTDPDQPNRRIDKMYPFAKSGYEPINNGMFFYYKSAANKLGSDQQVVDTLYNMVIDGSFLALMPPSALYGSEEFNASVYIPGMVTSFKDPNTKLEAIGPKSDIRGGMEAISMVENSMSESSYQPIGGGSRRTAREMMMLEDQLKITLGLFAKMIGFLVKDIGNLMMGDILQHMTVAQVSQITGDMKYRSFILPEKNINGKSTTKKIQFMDPSSMQDIKSPDDYMDKSYELLDEEGGPDANKKIYQVNPQKFRQLKYLVQVDIDELESKSKTLEKALNLEFYDRAIQNAYVDQEAITRDFLVGAFKPGEADKYMKKQQPGGTPSAGQVGPDGQPIQPNQQKGVNTSMLSQITGSNSLGATVAK